MQALFKNRPVLSYLLITFFITYLFWFLPVLIEIPRDIGFSLNLIGGCGPLIAAFLITALLLGVTFLTFRNARQKQQVNEQLRQLDQTKSQFFANVSHELRTPLTLIVAPLKNAIGKVKNQLVKGDLELAQKNGQRLRN